MLSFDHDFKPVKRTGVISDFFINDRLFFFATVKNTADLRLFLQELTSSIDSLPEITLTKLKELIKSEIQNKIDHSIFIELTLAGGVCVDKILYLITEGKGQIILTRKNSRHLIIEGDNCASGLFKAGDAFNLTLMMDQTSSEDGLNIRFTQPEDQHTKIISSTNFLSKRWLTGGVVFILFIILLWSVVFGVKRRADAIFKKQLLIYQNKIEKTLTDAVGGQDAFDKSLMFIAQAKKQLEEMKKIAGKRQIPAIDKLEKTIVQIENNITKKEEKSYEEFYDLNLIEKNAQGKKLSVDGDLAVIFNPDAGKLYLLSLSQKSTKTFNQKYLKDADFTAFYGGEIFVYGREGVIKIDKDKKAAVVVPPDPEWGNIGGFAVYNGNLYLLDTAKDEVYKYLVVQTGYSAKTSYFKNGQSLDLEKVNSLAIDGSIYLTTSATIYRYTVGGRDGFSLKIPGDAEVDLTKIFTDKTLSKIYLLDRKHGKIFISAKTGEFEKQITSSILTKADDFIVRERSVDNPDLPTGIFVLVANKIYKVPLD